MRKNIDIKAVNINISCHDLNLKYCSESGIGRVIRIIFPAPAIEGSRGKAFCVNDERLIKNNA
jgi:hypothetical protein